MQTKESAFAQRKPRISEQGLWFLLVGAAGFLVDGGALLLCTELFALDPYRGRLLSFILAATFTWHFNRTLTFKAHARATVSAWLGYLGLMMAGAAVNLTVYSIVVRAFGHSSPVLMAGLMLGTLSGLFINFTTARAVLGQRA